MNPKMHDLPFRRPTVDENNLVIAYYTDNLSHSVKRKKASAVVFLLLAAFFAAATVLSISDSESTFIVGGVITVAVLCLIAAAQLKANVTNKSFLKTVGQGDFAVLRCTVSRARMPRDMAHYGTASIFTEQGILCEDIPIDAKTVLQYRGSYNECHCLLVNIPRLSFCELITPEMLKSAHLQLR